MTRERFAEILKEYNYNDYQIEILWNTAPPNLDDEERLRKTAAYIAPIKDQLRQK